MNAWVPKELAARLSTLPRRPCPLHEAGHEPHRPVFAEILDRTGHGTGHFVRLPQSMVEMITREAKAPGEKAAGETAPGERGTDDTSAAAPDTDAETKPRRRRPRKPA